MSARKWRTATGSSTLTDHFRSLSPYAARSAFETWILPRRHSCLYESALSGDVVAELAGILSGLFRTLAAKIGRPPVRDDALHRAEPGRQDPAR